MDTENPIVYRPSQRTIANSNIMAFINWLSDMGDLPESANSYIALHAWSVEKPEAFWSSLVEWLGLVGRFDGTKALDTVEMPGAQWFVGAEFNYAENVLREAVSGDPGRVAITA